MLLSLIAAHSLSGETTPPPPVSPFLPYNLPVSAYWGAVCCSGSKYVAVAYSDASNNVSNIAVTSSDAVTWTQRTLSSSLHYTVIAYGAGLFLATGTGASGASTDEYSYSADGINWTTSYIFVSCAWDSLVFNGSYFVITGRDSGFVFTLNSPDGLSWSFANFGDGPIYSMASVGDGSSAVGGFYNGVITTYGIKYTSDNGFNWGVATTPSFGPEGNSPVLSITNNGYTYAAMTAGSVSVPGVLLYSNDGSNWTQGTLPTYRGSTAMSSNGSMYLAVSDGYAMTSTEGINWYELAGMPAITPRISGPGPSYTYNTGPFVILAADDPTSSCYLYYP